MGKEGEEEERGGGEGRRRGEEERGGGGGVGEGEEGDESGREYQASCKATTSPVTCT